MKKAKKERLQGAGWKIGSVSEFLELSPQEVCFIEMKLSLARNLRLRRQRRKLTQTQLAKLLDSSQSRVAKMEAADSSVSLDLLIRSLLALGAKPRDVARALASAEQRRVA
jgi:DNA-binding XRE family transcriptional regulator